MDDIDEPCVDVLNKLPSSDTSMTERRRCVVWCQSLRTTPVVVCRC